MTNFLYTTSLDGMRTIATKEEIKDSDYVFIKDELYVDDVTLFKNKKTAKGQVDLKMVNLPEIKILTEEEQEGFKNNQLYEFENQVFTCKNRLNKNQLLEIGPGKFYLVEDIIKHADKPLELKLTTIPYIKATNMYTILQTSKETYETKVYGRYPSYGEALGTLIKLRGKRDENYYRFP